MNKPILCGVIAMMFIATPAAAEVKSVGEHGFLVVHAGEVEAKPDDVWKRLLLPKDYWNPDHSWSGSVDGFYIDAQAGGCFCELVQEKDKAGKIVNKGSVEHMRVIFTQPGRVLRMQGALGPLQSEAVIGTLTVAIEPSGAGSKLSFNYIVGGYSRFPLDKIAPSVDRVLGEQFERMIKPLGKIAAGDEGQSPGGDKKVDGKAPAKAEKVGKPEKVEPVDKDGAERPE